MGFGGSTATQQPATQSIDPAQIALQNVLTQQAGGAIPGGVGNLTSGGPAFPLPFGGQYAAPLTPDQFGLIGDIEQAGTTGAAMQPINSAQSALTQVLSGQPQDFSQYFTQDIAEPLENTFNTQTLPGIKASFARSAGGTNSVGNNTGYSAAVGQATDSLNRTLGQANTALGTQAETTALNNRVQGIGLAPSLASSTLSNLTGALNAAGLPQQTEQTQISGEQAGASGMDQLLAQLFGQSSSLASTPSVQQGNTLVSQGNTSGTSAVALAGAVATAVAIAV